MNLELKLSYPVCKKMKKLYGKNLAREIAIGRKLVKAMRHYATNRTYNTL